MAWKPRPYKGGELQIELKFLAPALWRVEERRWPMAEEEKKLTEEEFVIQAIKKLRKEPYRGIHSVYSGFNEAFRSISGRTRWRPLPDWLVKGR